MTGAVNELPQVGARTIRLVPAPQRMEEEYHCTLQHLYYIKYMLGIILYVYCPETLYKHANAYENA